MAVRKRNEHPITSHSPSLLGLAGWVGLAWLRFASPDSELVVNADSSALFLSLILIVPKNYYNFIRVAGSVLPEQNCRMLVLSSVHVSYHQLLRTSQERKSEEEKKKRRFPALRKKLYFSLWLRRLRKGQKNGGRSSNSGRSDLS